MQAKGKILVTGGTGYIGSHTVVELINEGYDVIIADNLENSYSEVLNCIEKICGTKPHFHNVDFRNYEEVKNLFDAHNDVAAVIHFAAYKAVGESVQKPLDYYYNNLTSLMHLLKEMEVGNCNRLVFSSSCTVYAQPDELPVSERSEIKRPASPYGNTKKVSEELLQEYTNVKNFNCISLRYFNPIGAHRSALLGELPIGIPNNLVPYITQTAAGKRAKVTVFGGDYDTADGTCIRDYIHVTDVAKAHVISVKRLLENKNKAHFEAYNLGTGTGYSVLDVINAFEKVTGQKLNYEIGPKRSGDVTAIYSDTKLANSELGWRTEEDLESMMKTAWEWQLKIPALFPGI